jgi:hypothetical protein
MQSRVQRALLRLALDMQCQPRMGVGSRITRLLHQLAADRAGLRFKV